MGQHISTGTEKSEINLIVPLFSTLVAYVYPKLPIKNPQINPTLLRCCLCLWQNKITIVQVSENDRGLVVYS